MPECLGCNSHVSHAFARVHGGEDGVLACRNCETRQNLHKGAAAGLDPERLPPLQGFDGVTDR